eukprot:c35143_g1_i1 orf=2-187(-)
MHISEFRINQLASETVEKTSCPLSDNRTSKDEITLHSSIPTSYLGRSRGNPQRFTSFKKSAA